MLFLCQTSSVFVVSTPHSFEKGRYSIFSPKIETNIPDQFIPGCSWLLALAIRCYPHRHSDSLQLWVGQGLGTSSSGDMNFQGPDPQVGFNHGEGEELGAKGACSNLCISKWLRHELNA